MFVFCTYLFVAEISYVVRKSIVLKFADFMILLMRATLTVQVLCHFLFAIWLKIFILVDVQVLLVTRNLFSFDVY